MASILTQKDNTGQNFTDYDFSEQDLSGYIFKSCTLTGTSFKNCTFDALTDFTGAFFGKSASNKTTCFSGCDLSVTTKFRLPAMFGGSNGSAAYPADLTNAKVAWNVLGANASNVDITGATLTGLPADFSRLQFAGVKWNNYNFGGKSLLNSHFSGCDLTGCVMTGSVVDYVSFIQGTNLTNVKMNNCSLYRTVFDGSTLTGTDLSYATKIGGCSFLNTLLKGTIFDGNNLTDSKFGVPNLTGTDPEFITSYQYATLTADFLITNLQKKWQCADFRNSIIPDFSTIINQLYNLQAHDSFFNNALSFQNAKLNGANFNNTTFNGVNFNNAFLNNVNFVGAKTAMGNVTGRRAAVFNISQANGNQQSPNDFNTFSTALQANDLATISNVFNHYGLKVGNISSSSTTDPVSQNPAWKIVDQQTSPNRTYMAVKSPIAGESQFEFLVYDNTASSFSYAFMIGSFMETIDFSNAKMDHSQLYGSTITFSNLSSADLTGAQLGQNGAVFSLAQTDTSTPAPNDFASFLTALKNSNTAAIVNLFQYYGYTIGNILCSSSVNNAGNSTWTITDQLQNPSRLFSVEQKLIPSSSTQYELDVTFADASPANLDNSYMAGIVLTMANLTACSAEGSHLYNDQITNSNAVLNHTVLTDVSFVNANLYGADFTSAILDGANFTNANLMTAIFKGVTFKSGTNGKAVAFNSANLQGTDFSSSQINGGNFLSAAICLPLSTASPNVTNGVWLHRVPASDSNLQTYIGDLNNASTLKTITDPPPSKLSDWLMPGQVISSLIGAIKQKASITLSSTSTVQVLQYQPTWTITDGSNTYLLIRGYDKQYTVAYNLYLVGSPTAKCTIDYSTNLVAGKISQTLIDTISANSLKAVTLSATAVVNSGYQRPVAWAINDSANMINYTLWWGATLGSNSQLANVTFMRQSFSLLPSLFNSFGISLRPQCTVTKTTDATAKTTTWLVDIGKEDSFYLNTGYIQFKIVGNSDIAPSQIDVYGYTMRMSGLGSNQQEMIQDFDCQVTKITADNMDSGTLLPNNATKLQNQNLNRDFSLWMQIYNVSPTPPICVPTGISYCQRPSPDQVSLQTLQGANEDNWQMAIPQLKLVL